MPRSKKKYNERLELGRAPDGSRIRKWIRSDSKVEFDALKREAYREFKVMKNVATTFGAYSQRWYDTYKANKSISTQTMYTSMLGKMEAISSTQIQQITDTDLQEVINDNWDHPRICEQMRLTMRQICRQAMRDGIIPHSDLSDNLEIPVKVEKVTRFITDDEMGKILECKFKPQDRLYIDVLRNTGMRPSEALALKWEDIDFTDKMIHVKRSFEYEGSNTKIKGTKTNTLRDIPLNNSLASALSVVRQAQGYVFIGEKTGGPFTKSAYRKMYDRIFQLIEEKIGNNDIVMYSFRHTFATFLYYNGCRPGIISTKKAAQIMGHSEQIFLRRYTHIDDSKENVAEIMNKIE